MKRESTRQVRSTVWQIKSKVIGSFYYCFFNCLCYYGYYSQESLAVLIRGPCLPIEEIRALVCQSGRAGARAKSQAGWQDLALPTPA